MDKSYNETGNFVSKIFEKHCNCYLACTRTKYEKEQTNTLI